MNEPIGGLDASMTRRVQMIIISVVWGLTLFGYSKLYTPAPTSAAAFNLGDKPQIVTTFSHFYSSESYDRVYQSAKHLDFIATVTIDRRGLKSQSEMEKEVVDPSMDASTAFDKDAIFYLKESELPYLNIMLADKTFRESGFIPKKILLKNISHFKLVALDLHLCCGLCESAAKSVLKFEKERQDNEAIKRNLSRDMRMLSDVNAEGFEVDKKDQKITAEYHNQADVTAFLKAIEKAGFEPQSIKIEILK